MAIYKTDELTGDLLNRAVAKAIDYRIDDWTKDAKIITFFGVLIVSGSSGKKFNPLEDWSQCGQLIERFNIEIKNIGYTWSALVRKDGYFARNFNQDLKTAICRCVVKSVFGEEVGL